MTILQNKCSAELRMHLELISARPRPTGRVMTEVRALLEARRPNCVSSLVQRLLAAMCDCTVHLDSDLRIARPCPRLASLLMRPSAATPMLSQALAEFLAHDERSRKKIHLTILHVMLETALLHLSALIPAFDQQNIFNRFLCSEASKINSTSRR